MTEFGKLLKQLRRGTRQTLRLFCKAHGFKASWVSEVERGIVKPPNGGTLFALAHAVGLKPDTEQWDEFVQAGRRDDAT